LTWTTRHNYDTVYQASLDTCARVRALVTASNKEEGTIRAKLPRVTYEYHIKALNTSETQITMVPIEVSGFGFDWPSFAQSTFAEVQAVLAGVSEKPTSSLAQPNSGTTGNTNAPNTIMNDVNRSIQNTDDRLRYGPNH